jgi:hypothetical protein
MRRIRSTLVLLLLPLWFLSTAHCGIESLSSLLADGHCAGNFCSNKQDCERDACELLEEGGYRGEAAALLAKPVFTYLALPFPDALSHLQPWSASPPAEVDKPPIDYAFQPLPAWQFERRAVPLPGAPPYSVS